MLAMEQCSESSRNQIVGGKSGSWLRRPPAKVPEMNTSVAIRELFFAETTRESSRTQFVGCTSGTFSLGRPAKVPEIKQSGATRELFRGDGQ
jgi:hypothetical protein